MPRAQEWRRVHNVMSLGKMTLLRARERRHGLGDGACVVDGITGSDQGRWKHVKGLDRGRERWCRGYGEDSTTARRLQARLDDGTKSMEADDGVGSMEIFGGKFWQPDDGTKVYL
jgi:hypothetical protein